MTLRLVGRETLVLVIIIFPSRLPVFDTLQNVLSPFRLVFLRLDSPLPSQSRVPLNILCLCNLPDLDLMFRPITHSLTPNLSLRIFV
ncbi:hypothetical protein F5051DRAFT_403555 [Lentinula edodes]|nr:hypothetical protein F5051DRAFT_403555 [Lentinula edodes]